MRIALRIASAVVVAAALAFAAAMLAAAALGYERYVITGDSMHGAYDRGSLLFSERVPVEELRVGDVITYEPPGMAGNEGLVTHRIVSIEDGRHGLPVLRTRGDANPSRDPWRFALPGPEQARAAVALPYAGFAFAALGMRGVRMLVIGLPALLIAMALLARLWRQAGEEARELNELARSRLAAGKGLGR